MPCIDPRPTKEDLEIESRINDGRIVALCRACSILESSGLLPDYLRPWLVAHRETDAARNAVDEVKEGPFLPYENPIRQKWHHRYGILRACEARERDALLKLAEIG